jgi:hypothetical protein
MTEEIPGVALTEAPTNSQSVFVRYLLGTLIDLTILNLFDEFWVHVSIPLFSISILAALLLQLLLKGTLALEHRVANYFKAKPGRRAKLMRLLTAWLILFGSKFVMLGLIDFVFADNVLFMGPLHGVVAFIAVVIVMLVAEDMAVRLYKRLGRGARKTSSV